MAFLGGLVVWAVCLTMLAALAAAPVLWAWSLWQRVQRQRRPREDPYDQARRRAVEAYARERGERDALRELEQL